MGTAAAAASQVNASLPAAVDVRARDVRRPYTVRTTVTFNYELKS